MIKYTSGFQPVVREQDVKTVVKNAVFEEIFIKI